MKFVSQSRLMVLWLSFTIFTVSIASVSHAAAIEKDTLEVAYLFDGNSANVVKDISGNDRDGALTGAKRVEGVFGNALEYDGSDDNVIVTGFKGIGGTNPRTTVFWFKSDVVREHSWVKWGINSPEQKYYIRSHIRGNACNLRVEVNGGQNYGGDNVCDGEWHHCAVVFPEGSDAVKDHDLYVDGKLQDKEGTDKAMNTNIDTQDVNMGARLANHVFMLGSFDEVAIFNVALDLKQINAIRNTGLQTALGVDPQEKLTTSWAMIKVY